jgi:bacterioferritin
MPEETMDAEAQIECLNRALRLQLRSVLEYVLVAGSVIGLEYQAHAEKMHEHARSELEDAARLVEKVTALGGEPTVEVAPLGFERDPGEALDRLIENESEALGALQAAIEPTGREAASEAVEHRLEHMIMRKQEQVDYLLRVRRRP